MADLTVGGGPPVDGEAQTFTVTTFAQTLLNDADAAAVRSTIGAGTSSVSSKSDIGLSNADNTSDADKPVSSATQTALDAKQATLVSGTNIKTINGSSVLGSGDLSVSGSAAWGGVTGTLSDQTDLQAALDGKSATGHTHAGTYEPANANIQSHIASAHAPSNAQKNSDITLAEIEAKLVGVISSHSHAGGGSNPFVFEAELAGNVSTGANTTPVDVTGLVFNYLADSTYVVEVFGATRAAATTTGIGLQLNLSSVVTSCWGSFSHQLANTGTVTGGSTIADDASVGVSSGRPSTNTATPFYFSCLLKTGANAGTAQLRLRSEVSAVATINAGSFMRVYKKA